MNEHTVIVPNSVQSGGPEFKVSLRILGARLDFQSLSTAFGHLPSRTHKAGEKDIIGKPFDRDMWLIESPLRDNAEFNEHVAWLRNAVGAQMDFLWEIMKDADLSLVFNYRTYDTDQGGFALSAEALRMCTEIGARIEFHLLFV